MINQRSVIHWSKAICGEPGGYIGWPTIAATSDGELLAVFSGDREEHVCPYGKTELIRSRDGGETWSDPEIINSTPLDDRDAGIIVLRSGTIVISWFTRLRSVSEWEQLRRIYPSAMFASWQRHLSKISQEVRQRWFGNWTRRSTDGGRSWEPAVNSIASAPHGPIELQDGRLLYVGVDFGREVRPNRLVSVESTDEGQSWHEIGTIPAPLEETHNFHEPHSVELADGKLVCLWRYQPRKRSRDTHFLQQCESTDGGRTWSLPHLTPMWGYPPHLIRLKDETLLATYGHRRPPYGQRACLSYDGGESWDIQNEVVLRNDAPNPDLGYPASVELEPGELLTVYYQIDRYIGPHTEKTSLMATRWSLVPDGTEPGETHSR